MVNGVLDTAGLGLAWVATNSGGDKKNVLVPDRALCRYQFLEIILRLAEDMYITKKVYSDFPTAIQKMFDTYVMDYAETIDHQKWRCDNLWNEGCDVVLKHYLKAIKAVYKKYSGDLCKPGEPPFMSIQEF